MIRIGVFLIGFVVAMIPAVNYLARKDPEPDMAGLSLIFFGFFALIASIGAFSWSAARSRVSPGKVMAFCTGAACAIGFYVALGLIHAGLGLLPALGLSFALALSTAWASPLLSRAGV